MAFYAFFKQFIPEFAYQRISKDSFIIIYRTKEVKVFYIYATKRIHSDSLLLFRRVPSNLVATYIRFPTRIIDIVIATRTHEGIIYTICANEAFPTSILYKSKNNVHLVELTSPRMHLAAY